jgi:hypothetical protein
MRYESDRLLGSGVTPVVRLALVRNVASSPAAEKAAALPPPAASVPNIPRDIAKLIDDPRP